ncbi:MAG: hypothetical protein FWE33_06460 [Defluviitaleaceae bacterium]|nr:hypothetical protein [Defluviitaleaceae bacterium]
MKKLKWLLPALLLVLSACNNTNDELAQQEEYFRALIEEKTAIIEDLQEQIEDLQFRFDNIRDIREIHVPDAGRTEWRNWWGWQDFHPYPIEGDFTMRIYSHPMAEYDFENFAEIEISAENWEIQIIQAMQEFTFLVIDDLWFEETRLVVDLNPEAAVVFNWGTSGGYFRTRALLDSLATVPNVTEIIVLVGGERGLSADHFSFAQIFRVENGQWMHLDLGW